MKWAAREASVTTVQPTGASVDGDLVIESVTRQISDQLAGGSVTSETLVTAVLKTLSEAIPGLWVLILMGRDPTRSRVFTMNRRRPDLAAYVDTYIGRLFGPGVAETTGLSQQVIEHGAPIVRTNLSLEQFLALATPRGQSYFKEHPMPLEARAVSAIMLPMRTFGATTGTLAVFQFDEPHPLDETDVSWLQRVADRTALGAESADLRKISDRRGSRLDAFNAVSRMVASARERRPVLDVVVDQLRSRLSVDAADVLVLDEATGELVAEAGAGFHSAAWSGYRFAIPPGVTDTVHDTFDMVGESRRRSLFMREGFHAYRLVPLQAQSRLVGAIELFHRSELELDPEENAFVDAIASLAAVAVHRSPRAARRVPAPNFNRRDFAILRLLVAGLTNRDIADELHLSPNTVKFHVRELLDKAQAANRTELASLATENGWLDPAG